MPDEVKSARQEELLELQRAISAERLARYVGRDTVVLVDDIADSADPASPGHTHTGRVPWQADDVDGVTYVAQGGWARSGEFVPARIEACEDVDFHATALP